MPRIGFLHTAKAHVATFEALVRDVDDRTTCVHGVEPDLLARARANGLSPDLEDATLACLERLAGEGVDVIVCTCSTLGPVTEAVGTRLPIPVMRVDRPMARAAVLTGSRVAVIAALESTLEPTHALLTEEAQRHGVSLTIIDASVPAAWEAFEAGDTDRYLRQVAQAARYIAADADVVVLAQASMKDAIDDLADLRTPVLASPTLAVQDALARSGR